MNIYKDNQKEINKKLKIIWDYMHLDSKINKSDLIIGCGALNKKIPKKCWKLYNLGYAPIILFAGGYGKITQKYLDKSEAETFRDIAVALGVPRDKILLEKNSFNTRDNLKYAKKVLKKQHLNPQKIIIVHNEFMGKRVETIANDIFKNKEVYITSPTSDFYHYLKKLDNLTVSEIDDEISIIVGDIQRLIIYPQFGWQMDTKVPSKVIKSYYYLVSLGFNKYCYSRDEIRLLCDKYCIPEDKRVYFV